MKTQKHKLTAWLLTLAMPMTFMPCFTLMASAADSCGYEHTVDLNGDCTVCGEESMLDVTYSGDNYTGISVKLVSFDTMAVNMTLPDDRGYIRVRWDPLAKNFYVDNKSDEDIKATVPRLGDACTITEMNEGTVFENGVSIPRGDLVYGDAYCTGSDAENVYVTLNKGYIYDFWITPGYTASKVDVPDIDTATINADAVGYYVEEMPIYDAADAYDWIVTMSDDVQYQSEVELPTLSGEGKVSFGIVLYGAVGDYTTSDISSVAVTY